MASSSFIEEFGKAFLPKQFRPKLKKYLSAAGVSKSPFFYIGSLFYVTLGLTLLLIFLFVYPLIVDFSSKAFNNAFGSIFIGLLVFASWVVIQLCLYAIFFLLGYFFLDLKIYRRTHEIEDKLADFLTLVSTNLKGGMSLEPAMWNSIKPKFGVLAHEITLVSKRVMTGEEISEALAELAEKYESPELRRTLGLIISEFEIGGKISNIIDDIVDNLKKTHQLRRQMQASVISYVIFISVIVVVIAPVMFALSYNLITFISSFVNKVGASMATGNSPSFLSNMSLEGVNPNNFKIFGYYATGTIAVLSSMIVSIIEKGTVKAGVKYIPVYLISSLVVYYIALTILGVALGGVTI